MGIITAAALDAALAKQRTDDGEARRRWDRCCCAPGHRGRSPARCQQVLDALSEMLGWKGAFSFHPGDRAAGDPVRSAERDAGRRASKTARQPARPLEEGR
jgi:hypothetical protein